MQRRAWQAVVVKVAATVAAVAVGAGVAGRTASAGDLWSRLGELPADVGFAVGVSDGASQAASPPGRAVVSALVDSGLAAETVAAWKAASSALDLTPEALSRELLGGEAILATRVRADAGTSWVLIADVSKSFARRVEGVLSPKPRNVVAGAPLFSVDEGRAVLARVGGGEVVTLVLAPGYGEDLLRDVVLRASREGARLADLAGYPLVRGVRGDVVVLRREGGQDGGVALLSTVGLTREGLAWRGSLRRMTLGAAGAGAGAIEKGQDAGARGLDRAAFAALAGDSLAVYYGPLEPMLEDPAGARPDAVRAFVRAAVEPLASVVAGASDGPVLAVVEAVEGGGSVTLAGPATGCGAIRTADRVADGVVGRLAREPEPACLEGKYPEAVRRLHRALRSDGGLARTVCGPSAEVSWYGGVKGESEPGWWLVRMDGRGGAGLPALAARVSEALPAAGEGSERVTSVWSVGVSRAAGLLAPADGGLARAASAVERVTWTLGEASPAVVAGLGGVLVQRGAVEILTPAARE